MPALLDLVRVTSTTTGTGTITLGSAVQGFLTETQAGAIDQNVYSYAIEGSYVAAGDEQVASARETGVGTYTASSRTLTRTVIKSTNSNALLNLTGDQQVIITDIATAHRELLTANRTYYVRTDGSDSNGGLVNTAGGAFATWNKAIDLIADDLDLQGFTVTIQGNNATHTDNALFNKSFHGNGPVVLDCAGGTMSVTSNDCISITAGVQNLTIQNVVLTTTTAGNGIIMSGNDADIYLGAGVTFGTIVDSGVAFANCVGNKFKFLSNYTISGSCNRHIRMFDAIACLVYADGRTVTLTGAPAWGTAFCQIAYGGVFRANTWAFVNTATGKRYDAFLNGIIDTGGGGASYFPGDVAGTTSQQGQYV